MVHRTRSILPFLCVISFAQPALAQGLTVILSQTGGAAAATQQTMQFTAARGRFDVPGLGQVFYNAETKTMRVVPAVMKAYMEYTPQSVQQAVAAGRGAAPQAPITYRRTGTNKVKQWPCTAYDGMRGTEKVVEICVADSAALGLNAADFKIVQDAIDLARGFTSADTIERIPVYGTVDKQGYAGFPVRRTLFRSGQPPITTELVEFRRETPPAANLDVPAGYPKVGQ